MNNSSTANSTQLDSPYIVDGLLMVPVSEISGRLAARAWAYSMIALGFEGLANAVLDIVGEAD